MWSWVTATPLQKLDRPPIVEVIWGVYFAPLDIDPVVAGAYWERRKSEFPRRQLHSAVEGGIGRTGIVINAVPRMRVWLLSPDESLIVQIQHNRFYLNWRQVSGASYPRFSGARGLGSRGLAEFQSFADFCKATVGSAPAVDRIELGKVDHMLEGEFWTGIGDLATMIPSLASVLRLSEGDNASAALRLQEQKDDASLNLAIDTTLTMSPEREPVRGVRVETTVTMALGQSKLQERFEQANKIANSIFAALVPDAERRKRFEKGKAP